MGLFFCYQMPNRFLTTVLAWLFQEESDLVSALKGEHSLVRGKRHVTNAAEWEPDHYVSGRVKKRFPGR